MHVDFPSKYFPQERKWAMIILTQNCSELSWSFGLFVAQCQILQILHACFCLCRYTQPLTLALQYMHLLSQCNLSSGGFRYCLSACWFTVRFIFVIQVQIFLFHLLEDYIYPHVPGIFFVCRSTTCMMKTECTLLKCASLSGLVRLSARQHVWHIPFQTVAH